MKEKITPKRIKKVIIAVMIFVIGIFGWSRVDANTNTLTYEKVSKYYSFVPFESGPRLYYLKLYQFNGKIAYCVELGKDIPDNSYFTTEDYLQFGYSKEQMRKIQLISYYGYEYPSHYGNYFYYMAAQELIWEVLNDIDVYWTDEVTKDNPRRVDIDSYKNEIMDLVYMHSIEPSFSSMSYEYLIDDTISIVDDNNILGYYDIVDDSGLDVSISGNSLLINNDGRHIGNYKITLKKQGYLNNSSLIYYNEVSQKLFSIGVPEAFYSDVYVSITGASLKVKKYDKLTNSQIFYGDRSLEGAIYGVYDNDNHLISEISTDSNGEAMVSNLPYGEYYVKELSASYGYELDDTVYSVVIDKKDNEVIVYEEPIVRRVEIYKTYGDEYEPEGGSIFDVYDDREELYTTIITDDNGYGSALLPYGLYTIRQRYSKDGYLKVDDFELKIDEDSDDVVSYNLNDKKIYTEIVTNPSTYDNIKKHFIWFIASFVLLIIGVIYSVIFYRQCKVEQEIYE